MHAKTMSLWKALESVGYVKGGVDPENGMPTICKPDPFAPGGYAVVGWMNDTTGDLHFPAEVANSSPTDIPLDKDWTETEELQRAIEMAFDAGYYDGTNKIYVGDFLALRDVIVELVRRRADDTEVKAELTRIFGVGAST